MSSNYIKGRNFEYRVKYFLEKRGCFVVRRFASAFPDLTCINPEGRPFFVECKSKKFKGDSIKLLSNEEYNKAMDMIKKYATPFFLFYKHDHKMKAIPVGGAGVLMLSELGIR